MTDDAREAAWGNVHEALPAGWRVGPAAIGDPLLGTWSVTALQRAHGRLAVAITVTGTGPDEVAALRDLDGQLRGIPKPDGTALDAMRRRLRLAYLEGAEEFMRDEFGRGMTVDEQAGVRARYAGR